MMNFGEYPLTIALDEETNEYIVVAQDIDAATACAIGDRFPVERLAIMQARGAAHGYSLNIASIEPLPSILTKGK